MGVRGPHLPTMRPYPRLVGTALRCRPTSFPFFLLSLTKKLALVAPHLLPSRMSEPGRKSLPHEIPLWVDPARETYFLTICARDRTTRPLLPIAPQLLDSIRHLHQLGKWWVRLALVMPDHVHLLMSCPASLAGAIRAWKHWTTHHLGTEWQRDFFEHRLRREESLREKADYILQNPVRAGLVSGWQDWPHFWIPAQDAPLE